MHPLVVIAVFGFAGVCAYDKVKEWYTRRKIRQTASNAMKALHLSGDAISMLGHCVMVGQTPPPQVIEAAVTQAYAMGRPDLASDIVICFIEPVVRAKRISPAPSPEPAAPAPAVDEDIVTVSGRSSPLKNVSNDDWGAFVDRLKREPADFATPKHVGMFRHRRDRLSELGIEDVSTAQAQFAALERDMTDAYRHAVASGMVGEYAGTAVSVDNVERTISLSGLLGIIQAAGLEGAAEWLMNPDDRKRFPHTTKIFLATNGVF